MAGKAEVVAKVLSTEATLATRVARDRRVDGHELPGPVTARDDPGKLMPEHERRRNPAVTDRPLGEPVEVRPADPDRRDAHELFVGAGRRLGLVMETKVTRAVETKSLDLRASLIARPDARRGLRSYVMVDEEGPTCSSIPASRRQFPRVPVRVGYARLLASSQYRSFQRTWSRNASSVVCSSITSELYPDHGGEVAQVLRR